MRINASIWQYCVCQITSPKLAAVAVRPDAAGAAAKYALVQVNPD